jgi:hypothetical protein
METDLDLLPPELRAQNRMEREIALPYAESLQAIDILETAGVLLVGWEPLASYDDGRFGAYPSQGIGGLSGLEVPQTLPTWDEAVSDAAANAPRDDQG